MANNVRRIRDWVEEDPDSRRTWLSEDAPDKAVVGVASSGSVGFSKEFEAADIETAAALAVAFLERMGEEVPDAR